MALLRVEKLNVAYGDVQVLWDVDLTVEAGDLTAIVGSNGVGKTTLLNSISGLLFPRTGQIYFDGASITRIPSYDRVRLGIAQAPEGRKLFAGMTVRENLLAGAYTITEFRRVNETLGWVLDYFPELRRRTSQLAGTMSGGEQQMCAIGRSLMSRPRLLLVDEMSLGLAPVIVDRLIEILGRINREEGMSILLVEQDVQVALELARKGYVIEAGRIALQGPSAELLADNRVKEAYLGL